MEFCLKPQTNVMRTHVRMEVPAGPDSTVCRTRAIACLGSQEKIAKSVKHSFYDLKHKT